MRGPRPLTGVAVLAAALLVGVVVSAAAQAAPGDLDLTFSGDGKQRTDFGFGVGEAAATVRQPDGKIVAVGTASGIGFGNFALARYNPNGSLDTSFSGDGKQTTDFRGDYDVASGVVLQADRKIVVVGTAGFDEFALARYNPNGSLDPSFSGDGRQTTDFGVESERGQAVALQANGKIVAVGTGGAGFALARYNPNGSLDPSFSADGKQTTDFGSFGHEASGVAIQADGKIVAVGTGGADFVLARYNSSGTLDNTFSGDGKQTTDFGGQERATGVALQGDGKIVAVGHTGDDDFALARYNPNGSLDTSFSGDGRQTTNFGVDFDRANGVAIQGDGKIVAVGTAQVGDPDNDFALARYNPDGSLDTTFSGDGRQTTDFGGDFDQANGVALQADGKIVAVGGASVGGDFALARYNPNGSLDTSFSGDGRQRARFPGHDFAGEVALQADGKIVAVGQAGFSDFAIARYNPNGTLDTSFSGDGRQTTDFDGGGDQANGVALQADGKIVAVGSALIGNFDNGFALARYNPNGTLDTSFSGDGKLIGGIGGGANGVAIQADGKIVVVGDDSLGSGFTLVRYNPDGSRDPSFSGDGYQFTQFGGNDFANGVAIQGDGKIVAVGGGGPGSDFAIARYNPDGSLDPSFSGDGKQTTSFGGGDSQDYAIRMALQGNGKIVVVGRAGPYPNTDFALARYNPNGTLDTTFSGDGRQRTNFGGDFDQANGVALRRDGKIVAAGLAGGGPTGNDFALARYNPNGSLDTSFSGDGRQRTNFGGDFDQANGVALQTNGRIVAVGGGRGINGTTDFAVARYLGG